MLLDADIRSRLYLVILMKLKYIFLLFIFSVSIYSLEETGEVLLVDSADVEEIALTNSVILHSINDRRGIFKMISAEKWRNYLPRVGISYFGLKNTNINQPDSQYNDIRIQLNQLVYDGGENFHEIESARLQELLNNQDWVIARNKISLEVNKAYLKFLGNKFKHSMLSKTIERISKLKIDSELESKSGFISELERLELESKIRDIELLSLKASSSIRLAEIDLKKQMNLPLNVKLMPKDSILEDYILFQPSELINVSDYLLKKPELKKSKLAIENLRTR
ncbi:hypothetical protein EHQ10_19125 [Leptospira bouyouniensis]|uniref:TolC family protein n=2 Tax=Leptospira bouyouniensis TaxID=2484911 RepID=A0ABY2KYX7_9LEPT|nr:hypothetical protein EHQ10_19125 [Leptospira bouyouniensis]